MNDRRAGPERIALLRDRLRGRARSGIELTVRTARESMRDRVHGLAAEASFWTMLSLPPLLLALLTLTGHRGAAFGVDYSQPVAAAILGWADEVFPGQTMREVVRPLVIGTLQDGDSELLSVSLLLALWSGSAASGNYVSAITVAYGMEGLRSFWRTRLLSLGLYVGTLIIGTILLPLLVLGPEIITRILTRLPGLDLTWLVTVGYWPLVSLLSLAALASLYHIAVPVRTRWRRDLPGAVVALVVWIGGSVALRTYLASGLRSDTGPAAAPIAVLLLFFLTALSVLIGAELNATIDDRWPDASTRQGRRDARERRVRDSGGADRGGAGRRGTTPPFRAVPLGRSAGVTSEARADSAMVPVRRAMLVAHRITRCRPIRPTFDVSPACRAGNTTPGTVP